MKNYNYLMAFLSLMASSLEIKSTVNLYIQNDTPKVIEFDRNRDRILYSVNPGARKATPSEHLNSIDAKYTDNVVYRKLDIADAINNAQRDGISSVIHIVPGSLYGIKVGRIDQVYDNIVIPLAVKMEVLRPLGLTLNQVDVPKFDKDIAAKILGGISTTSTPKEAETAYLKLAENRDRNVSEQVNDYRGYLLTKALRSFKV